MMHGLNKLLHMFDFSIETAHVALPEFHSSEPKQEVMLGQSLALPLVGTHVIVKIQESK
jgi:hypothetical protein